MKNGLYKKGLVLGILILFIWISIMPNVTAYDNIVSSDVNENNTASTSSQPDVIISGFKIDKLMDHSGEWYYRLYASIKNIGAVAVSSRFKVSIQAYKIRFFVPADIVESYSGDTMGNENIAPGGFASVYLESSYSSFFLQVF